MNFREKRTKFEILANRGKKYNEIFDKMEEEGVDLDEIPKKIAEEEKKKREEIINKSQIPFTKNDEVIPIGSAVSLGYENAHKAKSATKEFYSTIDKKFNEYKELKKTGNLDKIINKGELQKSKEQDEKMKEQIYKDHLNDLFSGAFKVSKKSDYGINYVFSQEMQEECDNQNFDYHQKKNDLKWYTEAYVKYKGTMRK